MWAKIPMRSSNCIFANCQVLRYRFNEPNYCDILLELKRIITCDLFLIIALDSHKDHETMEFSEA